MIKYSLVTLIAAAALFSMGCDDSECCGIKTADVNVAPTITRVLGMTNNSTVTCEPGTSRTLNATATDTNGNLDSNTYKWTVDGQPYTANSIDCPADGESKKVCVTVKDEAGLESNEVCITLKGQATPEPITCTPSITGMDKDDPSNTDVNTLYYSRHYTFSDGNCPNTTCTWSIHSTRASDGYVFDCLSNADHATVDENGSLNVNTCGSDYKIVNIDINCTGDSAGNYSREYVLTTAP